MTTTTATRTPADKARLLIKAACGDEYGDGLTVTDISFDYAEPGYAKTSEDGVIVFGNWNTARYPRDGEPPLTKAETVGARLCGALVNAGNDIEWLDEWVNCVDCYRAFRTQGDSYMWMRFGAYMEDDGYVCADCLRQDMDRSIDGGGFLNNPNTAITWATPEDLEGVGFVKWEPGNPRDYVTGWHPGQNDDPHAVFAEITERDPDVDVIFLIDGCGQFDTDWSVYVRPVQQDDES